MVWFFCRVALAEKVAAFCRVEYLPGTIGKSGRFLTRREYLPGTDASLVLSGYHWEKWPLSDASRVLSGYHWESGRFLTRRRQALWCSAFDADVRLDHVFFLD